MIFVEICLVSTSLITFAVHDLSAFQKLYCVYWTTCKVSYGKNLFNPFFMLVLAIDNNFFSIDNIFFVFQLVLKPTSSSVLRQPSQDTPGTLPAFVSHGLSDTAMSDETSQQPTASPLQAVSTIKALAAMQKSSPVFSANSFAHGSPLNSQTPSSLP